MLSDEEVFLMYGKNVSISRKGSFTLVHLDRPSLELIRHRTEQFRPEDYFDDDCWLCRLQREEGVIVFDDDSSYEDEDILLE
jgi:hypothetical protein